MANQHAREDSKDARRGASAKKTKEAVKEKSKKKDESVKRGSSASVRGRVTKEKAAGEKKKRAPTAFFIFSADNREAIKKANPGIKVTEVASKLGELWRSLSADKKAVYEKKAAAHKTE